MSKIPGLIPEDRPALRRQYEKLNPVELTRDILRYHTMLITKA
ncbi:hypothetical protein [Changpingibacter yushuensis]|nr:hypothetical protein [Changpingibacter yushuensis]